MHLGQGLEAWWWERYAENTNTGDNWPDSHPFYLGVLLELLELYWLFCPKWSYLWVAAGTEQHGHVGEHADYGKGNRGNALCVQHVWIVPTPGVAKDVSWLSAVTPIGRQ